MASWRVKRAGAANHLSYARVNVRPWEKNR
jgi:hypothetical protein